MHEDANTILALRNAWQGAINAGEHMRALAPRVDRLTDPAGLSDADLAALHNAALAQANAVMALRGLVEELRRHRGAAEGQPAS